MEFSAGLGVSTPCRRSGLISLREFKRDLALFVQHEERPKWLAGLGDEFVEQISLAVGQQHFMPAADF